MDFAAIVPYAAPLLGYVLIRAYTARLVLRSMMRRAPGVFVQPLDPEQATSVPPAAPSFQQLDLTQRVRVDAETERFAARAQWSGIRALGILALGLLAYGGILVLSLPEGEAAGSLAGGIGLVVAAVALGAILVAILSRFAYLGHLEPLWLIALEVPLIAVALLFAMTTGASLLLTLLAPAAATAIVVQWFVRRRRQQARAGDLRLLVLRVFGADRHTAYLFGPLLAGWKFLGTHFTIADPSYIRYQLSLTSGRARMLIMRIMLAVSIVVAIATVVTLPDRGALAAGGWSGLDAGLRKQVVAAVLWLLLIPIAAIAAVRAVRRRFIASPEQLQARIRDAATRRPRLADTFAAAPLFCHDDVWRPAVHELLGSARAVLMDLRGFTPDRRGVEYEIGLLLDRMPVSRVLFLVDP